MNVLNLFRYLIWSILLISLSITVKAQTEKLQAAVVAHPNDMEAHRAYLEQFESADEIADQYEEWIRKFPESATVPLAIAEKYGVYSPKRAGYLLRALEVDPNNGATWKKLALDASIRGNKGKQKTYMKNAVTADPDNLKIRAGYVYLYNNDPVLYKKKAFEFVKQYPSSVESISVLNLLGLYLKDQNEKIEVWEKLRNLFPDSEEVVFQVAMSRLVDSYIITEQYDKAIELATIWNESKIERLGFPKKLETAQTLAAVKAKMKAKKYNEAKKMLLPFVVQKRSGLYVNSHVLLTKVAILNKTGDTQAAYDSLMVFQAKTPIPQAQQRLETYGQELGKTKKQIKQDLRAAINKNAKTALPFELDSYDSEKKVTLDELKGKVILLSFWYPGCGPCRGEMPHIESAIKNIDPSKLEYIGVNIARDQDGFVKPFMEGSGYSFTPLGASETIEADYNIQYAPTNFIIDKDGKIAYSHFMVNTDNVKMLEMMIQSLL